MMKDMMRSLNQKMFLLTREEREYVQYTLELEQVLSALEEHLHESNDPAEVVRNALVTACQFYGGDWAGFLDIDMDLNLWTPYMWYNINPNDRTNQLLREFESSEFLYHWVAAMKENRPLMVPDCEAVKDAYPHEYEMYQRLHMHSVIAVSVKPFPTGFLVVRNPSRHLNQSSMLQMLAFVIIKGVSEKQMLDSAKQAWSPEDIANNNDIIINLFGGMEIYTSRGVVRESELKSPKISKMLTYLLLHPTRIVPPREIAETIWPEEASEQANPGQNMKHLIYRLRQHFLLLLDEQIVESTAYGYRLNPKLRIMSDIQQFDKYKEAAYGTASVISKVEFLKKALELYKGPVLASAAGDHWLVPVATHYSLEYLSVANELLKTLAELKDYSGVHYHAVRTLNQVPGNVTAHYWLIYAAYHQGSTEMAKIALREAEQVLTKEEYAELVSQLKKLRDMPFSITPSRAIL